MLADCGVVFLGTPKHGGREEAGEGRGGEKRGEHAHLLEGRGTPLFFGQPEENKERGARRKRKAPGQLVRYSDEVISSWQVFTLLSGTVFTSRRLWSAVLLYWILALMICLLILHLESEASHLQYTSFKALVDYLSTLIGFLLGMYVSNSLSRWWSLRMHIDHLWGCVDDLCMLACSHVLDDNENVELSTGVLLPPVPSVSPLSDRWPRQPSDECGEEPEARTCGKSDRRAPEPSAPERWRGEEDAGRGRKKAEENGEERNTGGAGLDGGQSRQAMTRGNGEERGRLEKERKQESADERRVLTLHLEEDEERRLLTKSNVLRLILRLGMVTMNLTFDAAERENGDLTYLQNAGLLDEQEIRLLQPAPSKAQVVWVWLSQLSSLLAKRGRLLFAANTTRKWHEICARGRGEVAACWAFVETQLPFSYVHLLSLLVHINNLFLSILTGVGAAACVSQLAEAYEARATWFAPPPLIGGPPILATSVATSPPGQAGAGLSGRSQASVRVAGDGGGRLLPMQRTAVWEVAQMLLMHLMLLIVIPIFYHGMINLAQTIGHPFGYKSVAFPKDLYVHRMEAECSSFFTVGQAGPPLFHAESYPSSVACSPSSAARTPCKASFWSSMGNFLAGRRGARVATDGKIEAGGLE
ncbi:conserved hypothetical protein [Neospora caninum Liverpool]|uniref:Bestrophin n=1 Tax=Neospora caninum (strain Liverpool) TaxID=572307 RepID=F0VMR1_NEOCL|nr:conserved hypothetical protein [Neospora caninum Liverpool]CBZ55007.1 conserved hypothetical protein [Neospora caninum Liverpool]CEL69732.1 TPA: hypothetical protein BN1204_054340 [Neospora caninum Liverpool]|eukprot:XP_003885035.1 conserved hypothetical protein [Neospora caninum Liverpool]